MAWFVQTLTILWSATAGKSGPEVKRDRPWYTAKVSPTFADMLGALRLQFWDERLSGMSGDEEDRTKLREFLKNWLAAGR
ncbi:MAG: transposase family protein [Gemmataceae bacterium]|nr:transposase family protein [Gemmataceae bacterium]